MPPPPGLPPVCGPAATNYSQVKEEIVPVPAQLRKVRVVAPYLAGVAWPRTPLAFFGNPQTFPNPIALGRYEWLVPAVEVKNEHFDTFMDPCCKTTQGSPLRVREGELREAKTGLRAGSYGASCLLCPSR